MMLVKPYTIKKTYSFWNKELDYIDSITDSINLQTQWNELIFNVSRVVKNGELLAVNPKLIVNPFGLIKADAMAFIVPNYNDVEIKDVAEDAWLGEATKTMKCYNRFLDAFEDSLKMSIEQFTDDHFFHHTIADLKKFYIKCKKQHEDMLANSSGYIYAPYIPMFVTQSVVNIEGV
jgi:hypothetical protein